MSARMTEFFRVQDLADFLAPVSLVSYILKPILRFLRFLRFLLFLIPNSTIGAGQDHAHDDS
jgi:hypothetical protein